MKTVSFVTCASVPELVPDDRLAAQTLSARGVKVEAIRWDAPDVHWPSFDAVVIRSAWDYHLAPGRYRQWLSECARDGTNLWNPPAAVSANVHKGYLASFEARGIPIVPTTIVPAAPGRELRDLLVDLGYDDVVIKPAVSANARGTWRTSRAAAESDRDRFARQSAEEDLLLQPYLPEIASDGEWSLMFFRGVFSHAVRKRPASGEFRVQEDFGGGAEAMDAPPALVAQARAVLDEVEGELLYARVDGVRRGDTFLLMELEINEPSLFLSLVPHAAERFAEAILEVAHDR